MAACRGRVFTSTILLAVYAACLCLVLSFILFEVLDIDGSDFPMPISRAVRVVKLADPPHDFKRGYNEPLPQAWIPVSLRFEVAKPEAALRHVSLLSESSSAPGPRRDRSNLARASLPAAPLSA